MCTSRGDYVLLTLVQYFLKAEQLTIIVIYLLVRIYLSSTLLFHYLHFISFSSILFFFFFFFSSRRRHTRFDCDWSSDVCSSDLITLPSLRNIELPSLYLFVPSFPPLAF